MGPMSVAFRRDVDENYLEPTFDVPIPAGPNLVTARGLALLGDHVLATTARLAAATEAAARAALERELRYLRVRLSTARIAPPPAPGEVGLGSRVRFMLNGAARTVDIVGGDEADPAVGRLGYTAPLARALIGARVGEAVAFAGREDAVVVEAIEPVERVDAA